METIITRQYLKEHRDEIFVFGDNTSRSGTGGAAILRNEPNVYGFITKKLANHESDSYYRPNEYEPIYERELRRLKKVIADNPNKTYLISKIGAGLANKYNIFEKIIEPRIRKDLEEFKNVRFLW
jgi:hypothetical protein